MSDFDHDPEIDASAVADPKVLCPDCGKAMEVGFLPEVTDKNLNGMTTWMAGPPEPLKFFGLKTGLIRVDWKKVIPVTTFRCPRCGLLKLYATRPIEG